MSLLSAFCRGASLAGLLAAAPVGYAQTVLSATSTACLLLPVEPADRARQATLVVEAEVTAQRSFWDQEHRHIYTANTLRVYKLLKGKWTAGAPLTVITEGGTVGMEAETLTNTLALRVGQQGLLFLQPAAFRGVAESDAWAVYASSQGFLGYDAAAATATEPFRSYPLVDKDFYRNQTELTGQALRDLVPNEVLTRALARRQLPPTAARGTATLDISSLSPTTVTAGTGTVLTIGGSGFGTARGSVEFRNANDGGRTFVRALPADIVSWADDRIQVRVPSFALTSANEGAPAGTGNVRVVTANQQTFASTGSITVTYAVANVQSTDQIIYTSEHADQNGRGGYTFQPDPGFAQNATAMQTFGRALASWRCQTGMNWELGVARTGRGTADDGINSLEFDQGSELPAQVLGRTTSYYLGCREANGQVRFWVKEVDMQFDDATSWQFGTGVPTSQQIDFETVAVHELGHGQQLGHVIAPPVAGRGGAVMHFAVGRGQVTRQLAFTSDILGGYNVMLRSVAPDACGAAPLLPAPLAGPLTGTGDGGQVQLAWATREECTTLQGFVVERSIDGRTWTRAGQVAPAAGNRYTFIDAQPPGELVSYRLQVQLNNGLSVPTPPTRVRTIPWPVFTIFPNPVRDANVQVEFNADAAGDLVVRVYDALGRYYGGQRLRVQQPGVNTVGLVLPQLRAGWYLLRWESGGQNGAVSFVRVE